MNKSDLIEALAQRKNITQKDADLIVNLIFDGMLDALQKGERIEIRGFGSLIVKHYSSYVGRNPKTGEKVQVPEKKLPFFKVGKELKERVDGRISLSPESLAAGGAGSLGEAGRTDGSDDEYDEDLDDLEEDEEEEGGAD